MGELKPSRIKCVSCDYEPNIITDICIKCGSRVVKICGNCGFENSVEKTRCDNCGELLALTPDKKLKITQRTKDFKEEKKINLEFEPIENTVLKSDVDVREKRNREEELLSKEERIEEEKKKLDNYINSAKKTVVVIQKPQPINTKKNKSNLVFIIIISFIVSFILSYFLFIKKSISRYQLIITTKKYLTALKEKDYEKAYDYLTTNSKNIVSFTDYLKASEDYYSKSGEWDFKDIKIYYFDENHGIIKYKLKEKNEWRDDYLNFIREYKYWKRPYFYNLLNDIDDALIKKDFSKALFLSQKLYLIDPIDPRTSGYLCYSEYFMRLYDKSVESCKKVLEISNMYPIKYYNTEELFWFKFNYADSLRFLGRDNESIEIYQSLISDNTVDLSNKCSVFLARSDSYMAIKEYDKAKNDLQSAFSICKKDFEKEEAEERFNIINGVSCPVAVEYLKRSIYDNISFNSFIEKETENIKKKNPKSKIFSEYLCNYKFGPVYLVEVLIKSNNTIVRSYNAEINLWKKTIDISKK